MTKATSPNDSKLRDPSVAYPPRFWWLKRMTSGFILLIVAIVIFKLWWGHEADRRFQTTLDSIRARGEPIVPEDFDVSGVPDEQNAALSLRTAADKIVFSQKFQDFDSTRDDEPLTVAQVRLVKAELAANAVSLELARRARSQPLVDWKVKLRSPVFPSPPANYLTGQRELVRLLWWSAFCNHAVGKDREAVEAVRDILRQCHVMEQGPTGFIAHLIAIGLQARACDAIEEIAPDLHVQAHGTSTAPEAAAASEQIRGLIAELLDDDQFRREAMRAWQGERMSELDSTRYLVTGGAGPVIHSPIWHEVTLELDGLRMAKNAQQAGIAAAQPTWPAALANMPADDDLDHQSHLQAFSTLRSQMLHRSIILGVEQGFRALVERRAAALRLAIRLYRIDHDGRYPATLQEMVPAYLSQVPADPYAADGRPMNYRAGAPFPAVYSVGKNGTDDGGTSLPSQGSGTGPALRWECADIVFPLEAALPTSKPSSEAQDGK